jgi:hypothetical protein
MTISIDPALLTSWFNTRAGIGLTGGGGASAAGAVADPTPPWSTASGAPAASALVSSVLAGRKFIDANAAKLDVTGADKVANANYQTLFGLYQGLSALSGLADRAAVKTVGAFDLARLQTTFQSGVKQVQAFLDSKPFDGFDVVQGAVNTVAKTTIGTKAETDVFTSGTLYSGPINGEVPAFKGAVRFSVNVARGGSSQAVDFDLSDMGSTPRTMGNVVNYLNSQLKAAGISTQFASLRTPGVAQTVTVGKSTVKLPVGPDQFALQVEGNSVEKLTFAAPSATPAVYLGQSSGIAADTTAGAVRQLVKYDAGSDPTADPDVPADGLVFQKPLDSNISAIEATATAPDGSVYMLGSASGTIGGQSIQGPQDLVLQKFDSAGNLLFTRTLGAQSSAAGLAMTVSADGKSVAVAGTVQGSLDSTDGKVDAATTDTLVTVFDDKGQEQWSQRAGAPGANDQPSAIAFGADGTVYVTGQTSGVLLGGGGAKGSTDGFLQAFSAKSVPLKDGSGLSQWVPKTVFSTQFGTGSQDRGTGVTVDGSSVIVSSVEDGHAVLRRYEPQPAGQPVLSATRDLGDLQGGDVAGVALGADGSIVVAGSTHNGALDAGTVTQAYAGSNKAAFVASLSADLQPASSDTLTYLGGGADQTASALTVSDGKVFITGQITTGSKLIANKATSTHDGYVAELDPATGQTLWSRQYGGREGEAAPASIAVAAAGASLLDKLGLPSGALDFDVSDQIIANTSVRAGDQFFIKGGQGGPAKAITIAAGETYKTLAAKITRALGFQATVTTTTAGGTTQLQIKPLNAHIQIEVQSGPVGRDALASLGLTEGLISGDAFTAKASAPGSSGTPAHPASNQLKAYYALLLPSGLNLNTPNDIKRAQAALSSALSTIRSAYRDMSTAPSSSSTPAGTVPAYLTKQIADYQKALDRLTGGG